MRLKEEGAVGPMVYNSEDTKHQYGHQLECQGNTVQAFQQLNIYKRETDLQPARTNSSNKPSLKTQNRFFYDTIDTAEGWGLETSNNNIKELT